MGNTISSLMNKIRHIEKVKKVIVWLVLLPQLLQPAMAGAEVSAKVDKTGPSNTKPYVEMTTSGLPIVQITTPTEAGVSHNRFEVFNVYKKGLILNNSRETVNTQLLGYIPGNPYMRNGTARIILNEVTGTTPTFFGGPAEVAGKRAQVIIANPNGISIDGGNFINASRATLTTGLPMFGSNGNLEGFHVNGGQIEVRGAGFDASNMDQVDLISRTALINAAIWGKKLNLIAGSNQVSNDTLQVEKSEVTAKPEIAIDVGLLGGMYANKIFLLGTETGVGVRSQGTMAATAEDIEISNAGKISLSGNVAATGNLKIQGTDIQLKNSDVYAGADGKLSATNGDIDNSGSTLQVVGELTANASEAIRNHQTVDGKSGQIQADKISLTATTIDNQGGKILQLGNDTTKLTAWQDINNTAGQMLSNGTVVDIQAGLLDNHQGRIEQAGVGTLSIQTAGNMNNVGGKIATNGQLTAMAQAMDNTGGQISAQDNLYLTAHGNLNNSQGKIDGSSSVRLTIQDILDNTQGAISAKNPMEITANGLTNQQGRIHSADTLVLKVQGALANSQGGIEAGSDLLVSASSLNNQNGYIGNLSQHDLNLNIARTIDNRNGVMTGGGNVFITGQTMLNQNGTITAQNDLIASLSGDLVSNDGSTMTSNRDMTLSSHGNMQLAGKVAAGGDLNLAAQTSLTNSGAVYAAGSVKISTGGKLTNTGIMAAGADNTITAASLDSTGTLGAGIKRDGSLATSGNLVITTEGSTKVTGQNMAGGSLSITAATVDLSNGKTVANDQLMITAGSDINLSGGQMKSGGVTALQAGGMVRSDNAIVTADTLTIQAASLSNRGGNLGQVGQSATLIKVNGVVDNTAGTIASNGQTTLIVGNLVNQGGRIQTSGPASADLGITAASGVIDNSAYNGQGGIIVASGNNTIAANRLNNTQGQVTAGQDLNVSMTQGIDNAQGMLAASRNVNINGTQIDNTQGKVTAGQEVNVNMTQGIVNAEGMLAANQNVNVSGTQIDNTQGTIGSVQGQTSIIASAGSITNRAGRIEAAQSVILSAVGLNNTDGVISGGNLRVNSNKKTLDNTRGKLITTSGPADIQSGALNNEAGLIQATGALTIDTHGKTLDNTNSSANGGIVGQRGVNLVTGNLNNRAGYVGSGGTLITRSAIIDNTQGGVVASSTGMDINANGLNNQGGQIQALGNVDINLSGTLDNTSSLVRSGQTLSISADTIGNTGTQGDNKGIEGQSVSLTASQIDNRQGAIRADNNLTLASTDRIDNTQGQISSGQILTLTDTNLANKKLFITNTEGTLIAGQQLNVYSASLSGDGKVLSKGDLDVKLTQNYTHTGELQANGNSKFETAGTLTNQSSLLAGGNLDIKASNIDNTVGNQIKGQNTIIAATGTLTNRGLIDGDKTLIEVGTLNNRGTGRIYGNHLAIQSNTLNNDVENGEAPVIAARERLDIGAQTIVNREHALIFSAGDMAIGGSLDINKQATGQGTTLNNNSATIEALGNVNLSVGQINNTNEHFSTTVETTKIEPITEYQGSGSPNRYLPGTPNVYIYNEESDFLHTPERNYESWSAYRYTQTTQETKVKSSDPGQILSGGAMQINSGIVTNDKSRIIAGGTLSGSIGTLNNIEAPAERIITDIGTATSYWRHRRSGRDNTGSSSADYEPPATIEKISLKQAVYQENTASTGTGTQVAVLSSGNNINQATTGANAANVTINGGSIVSPITQVATLTGAAWVRSGGVNTSIPNNSLFSVTPNPNAHYLVETDPRFADYRQWISSDYLLQNLGHDPSVTEKRLGDGFYEQKLVREQVVQLTGQRFLDGYSSDEAQYMALMNNAATFAKEYQLSPGVALSAEQMAHLTSDIVWLVEKDVLLPSGQTTRALVPQLYVRSVQDGDLSASGALIAGNNVQLNASSDLANSGTIAGRNVVALNAENIQNLGGRINGNDVSLKARTDLNNIGGQIKAVNSLAVSAGRDLNVLSTNRTQTNKEGSRTNMDRVAGLEVTGDKGTMVASAGRDINLLAAQISNSGKGGDTTLAAGNNLNLGTLMEGASNHIVWDRNNQRSDSSRIDVGTTIQTQGDVRLQAGNDLNAKAASIESNQGALVAVAANNVNLTAGEMDRSVDEAHQHKERGMFSSKTITTRDTLSEITAQSTTFSGDSIKVLAGQDINVKGSNVVATNDVSLVAQGNVSIVSAKETSQEEHMRKEKTSGIFSGGGFGFTVGSKSEKTTTNDQTLDQVGSTIGSTDGNVSITAGKKVESAGTTFVAGKDLSITGKDVTIDNTINMVDSQSKYELKQSGLSVSLGGGIVTAASNAAGDIKRSNQVEDERLKALYAYKAVQDIKKLGESKGNLKAGVSVSVSIGSSKMTSEQTSHTESVNTSNINAGGNVTVKATEGDVNLKGTKINATDVTLDAKKNINIDGAENKQQTTSNTSSSSWAIGGNIGSGFFANGSKGSGNENEKVTTNTGSVITASDAVTLTSGKDTNITGSQVKGDKVVANIGGDLNIASKQDTDNYTAKNQNSGFGLTTQRVDGKPLPAGNFGPINQVTTIGLTGSISKGKTDSTYASVTEQAGIFAGKDGFDITVGKNTDLKGAVIASTATPDKNKISTDTLTYSDIQNKADYSASSIGVNYATGGDVAKKDQGLTPNIGVTVKGDADSTTHSAISPGTIIVGGVKVDPVSLSRDTTNSVNALGKIFDKKTVQEQQELTKVFIEESSKAVGDLADAQLKKALEDAAKTKDKDPAAYQNALQQIALWKTGGDNKRLLDSVMGGITASLGGGSFASGAFSSGLNQALQGELSKITDPAAHQWASFVIGATASKILGGDTLTGGSITSSQTKNNDLNHDQQLQLAADLTVAGISKGKTTAEVKQNVKDAIEKWISINAQSDPNLKATDGLTIVFLEDAAKTLGITFNYDETDSLNNNLDTFKYKMDHPPTISADHRYDGLSPLRQQTLSDFFNAQNPTDKLLYGVKFLGERYSEPIATYRNSQYQQMLNAGMPEELAAIAADSMVLEFAGPIVGMTVKTGDVAGSGLGNLQRVFSSEEVANAYQGIRIMNKKYAGQVYELEGSLATKYPNGVKFSEEGFPDFSPYAKYKVKVDGMKGNAGSDMDAANTAAGFDKTPGGYTWHHLEDGQTMILIPTDLHKAISHTGGAALLRNGRTIAEYD